VSYPTRLTYIAAEGSGTGRRLSASLLLLVNDLSEPAVLSGVRAEACNHFQQLRVAHVSHLGERVAPSSFAIPFFVEVQALTSIV
jgi:hypothetical protein